MPIEIIQVTTKSQKKTFLELPWQLYQNDPHWVPPLKLALKEQLNPKHPFFETGTIKMWIAYQDNQPVGRIAAITNRAHNKFHRENCGFFGFFETLDDQEIAQKLFQTAENYLKELGLGQIRGPVSPSTNYECGTLVHGFDDAPQLMMTYNAPYHPSLLEKCRYTKAKDLLAYQIDLGFTMPERIVRISERAEKSHKITYRQINKKDWDNEVARMLDIYNEAWENNWGFIPMTKKEFYHTAKDLKSVVDERLILFCEVNGDPAGFIVMLPDFNQVFKQIPTGKLLPTGIFKLLRPKKYITRARVVTLGIKTKYRRLGLESLLYQKGHKNIKAAGFTECEMSWILEDNKSMNKALQVMGATPYKTYRIFEKSL